MGPLLLQAGASELPSGYASTLVQSLLSLLAICALAWVSLRWLASRGVGGARTGRLQVLEHVRLDARRSLWLVRLGDRVLLLGGGDHTAPTLLTELAAADVPGLEATPPGAFAEALRRASDEGGPSARADSSEGESPRAAS